MHDSDRAVLRELARQLADQAARPVQQERIDLWKAYNALKPVRPLVLCFPEGGWRDLVLDSHLRCQSELARSYERELRRRLFQATEIDDDMPVSADWGVPVCVERGDLGMRETRYGGQWGGEGAWHWEPPLKNPADVKKLHTRSVAVDWGETRRRQSEAEELFGDILNIEIVSWAPAGQFASTALATT